MVLGDFNAKFKGPMSNFTHNQRSSVPEDFATSNALISLNVQSDRKGPCYTYQGYESGPTTMIDHDFVSLEYETCMNKVFVLDELNVSDHLPVLCSMQLRSGSYNNVTRGSRYNGISWRKAKSIECSNDDIEVYYNAITPAILKASDEILPRKSFKPTLKPYWTAWISDGRPRNPTEQSYSAYKTAKSLFRRELRDAYNTYLFEVSKALEDSVDVDQRYVWSVLRGRKKFKPTCSTLKVDNIEYATPCDICAGFSHHFERIFSQTQPTNSDFEKHVLQSVRDIRSNLENGENESPTFDLRAV